MSEKKRRKSGVRRASAAAPVAAAAAPAQVVGSGFSVVPVRLSEHSPFVRAVYMKQHVSRGRGRRDDVPAVFASNLPAASTAEGISALFAAAFGPVQRVSAVSVSRTNKLKKGSGKQQAAVPSVRDFGGNDATDAALDMSSVRVEFRSAAALRTALAGTSAGQAPLAQAPGGVAQLQAQYRAQHVPIEQVKAKVDAWMAQFEAAEAADQQRRQELARQVDDDGFTVVVRKGRDLKGGGFVSNTASQANAAAAARGQSNSKQGDKLQGKFYRFQLRASQRDHIVQLRKKWEEDKARVAKLKSTRRFKPF